MRILFTRFPYESAKGGAERQTLSLMLGLRDRGHDVSFLGSCPVLLAYCAEHNIPHAVLDIGPPPVTKFGALSFFWRKKKMRRKLLQTFESLEKPDAVFMLSLSEKILLTPHTVSQNVDTLWVEHDKVGKWLSKNPSLTKLTKLSACVRTICVSELSANIFRNLGYQNVIGIPNGVEVAGNDSRSMTKDFTVGCIARLEPEKGIEVLLEGMEIVHGKLIVNGTGSLKIATSEWITVLNRVEDIEDVYKQIDVLVLPSIEEDPFGLVVAEAMMRGIPTVCTTLCGISEYLEDEIESFVVTPNTSAALVQAIKKLQDPQIWKKVSVAGRRAALEKFTVEKMVDHYEKMINV